MLRGNPFTKSGCPSEIKSVVEVSAFRSMKRSAARTTPTLTATTMSNSTVRAKHAGRTTTSPRGATWKDVLHVLELPHVPGDDQEQRRERRHRQVTEHRRRASGPGEKPGPSRVRWPRVNPGERPLPPRHR